MKPLIRISTAEAVVNHFKQEIRDGNIKNGDQLPSERDLMESFGISRIAVREGLSRLSALGIINIRHGKGAFVEEKIRTDSISDAFLPLAARDDKLSELLEARSMIECEIGALAAKRRTQEDIQKLQANVQKTGTVLNDESAFGECDYQFHWTLAATAKNAFLEEIARVLYIHVQPFLSKHAKDNASRKSAYLQHQKILQLIIDQDEEGVRTASRGHIVSCARNWSKAMQIKSN